MDPAILSYLEERKAEKSKKKIKSTMTEEQTAKINEDLDIDYSPVRWIPNAAKRSKQLFVTSHPGKFSHPSAKISTFIAEAEATKDGFFRTGNVKYEMDILGNAAAIDVYKFLSIMLADEKTILSHFEEQTDVVKALAKEIDADFERLRNDFLAIKSSDSETRTSGKIKQVYFPHSDDYHLLSIVTPSGLMFKLRQKIDTNRFSEQVKEARELRKKELESTQGFSDLYGLSVIGFGGTKPQNISVLNNANGGKAYLLPSLPPSLSLRDFSPPKRNFFAESVNPWRFKESFESFHRLIVSDYNNIDIRLGRDNLIGFIVGRLIDNVWRVRAFDDGWSDGERYAGLPLYQKEWLDQKYEDVRDTGDYLKKIVEETALWFLVAYAKVLGKRAKKIGGEHLPAIKQIVLNCEEGLR